ncbi:MAG: outer membrane protein assembly factor BamE [Gammaproteobacteria bacterium]|nr:outer membrane protein assembly factor BamE [Gammaproteobacteria bacterium]
MPMSIEFSVLIRTGIPLVCALALSACATEGDYKLPGVYRLDIQQGNVIEQEMIDKLKPGMDKNQVRFILGTPVLVDTFHENRWEYVFMYSEGGKRREQRHITVYFQDDKLSHVNGDIAIAERKPADLLQPQLVPVDVPLSDQREGFFSKLFNSLPFVGEDKPAPKKGDADREEAQAGGGMEPAEGSDAQASAIPQPESDQPVDAEPASADIEPEDVPPADAGEEAVPAPAESGSPQ